MAKPQPWKPADATDAIRQIAAGNFTLSLSGHAKDQLRERDLSSGDVLHALKRGFVYSDGQRSTRPNCFKYKLDSKTPNSGSRTVRVIAVPCASPLEIKVVTVMWRDEDR